MKRVASRLTRGAIANALGGAGALSLVSAAWQWSGIAGMASLGVALLAAGWAVDE